jgi:hypothetical protein
MTEEELLDNFEAKVKRYLSEPDGGIFAPAATEYFDAAQNLGAALLLRVIQAHREHPHLLKTIDNLKNQIEAKSHELTAESVLLERAEAEAQRRAPQLRNQVREMAAKIEAATTTELAKANDELRATVRQANAMEYAGCDAIAALRSVESNPGLSEAQHALVAEALLGMFAAKPRWMSRPAENGRNSPNSEYAA